MYEPQFFQSGLPVSTGVRERSAHTRLLRASISEGRTATREKFLIASLLDCSGTDVESAPSVRLAIVIHTLHRLRLATDLAKRDVIRLTKRRSQMPQHVTLLNH
jgi:hypothetical protein